MTEKELQEIERRSNTASSGPWWWRTNRASVSGEPECLCNDGEEILGVTCADYLEPSDANKDFIVHARNDVPALVTEVRQLKHDIEKAAELIVQFGGIDGAHHKSWVLDQVFRVLTGDQYEERVRLAKNGRDGPNTYDWDEGIAP